MTIVLDLPRQIDETLAADIEKESAFVSPYLAGLKVNSERTNIAVELTESGKDAEVRDKVGRFLDAMLKRVHQFDTKVFYENQRKDQGPFHQDVHAELKKRGWLYDYGAGHVALNGPPLALARAIDAAAAGLYRQHFGIDDRQFPALIKADLLARCGYFESHPNAVCFVGHVMEDFDAIEDFRVKNANGGAPVMPPAEHVHLPGMCLNPAACFPSYTTLQGQSIPTEGRVLSWNGKVFRFESRNVAGLDRLWEFSVREIVFVGTEEHVRSCRERALPLIAELAERFDLECQVETAADPFFATVSAAKTFWQQAQEVKNEIMIPIGVKEDGTPRRLACGSVNLHGNFFGERFDIKAADGAPAFTACIGLGVERWVLAAFAQHGFEDDRWPADVRNQVFG